MIHFFHEAHSTDENNQLKQQIVKQQLNAWYFLHRLLTEQWEEIFSKWSQEIIEIDRSLRKLHEFLDIIFENCQTKIIGLKKSGHIFTNCPSCGFEAKHHDNELNISYESECLVCGLNDQCLQIECTDCGSNVIFENSGYSTCEKCSKKFDPKALADILIDKGAAYVAAMDGDNSLDAGNCSECEGYHSVVKTENEEYICANCLEVFDSLELCQWCNDPNTGEMGDSYAMGCNFCEGYAGWHADD